MKESDKYKTPFIYNGINYYIDSRYPSPYGYKYDIWYDGTKNNALSARVTVNKIYCKLQTFIDRQKKITNVLNRINNV